MTLIGSEKQTEQECRNRSGKRAISNEEHDADDADDAQRHDPRGLQCRDTEAAPTSASMF